MRARLLWTAVLVAAVGGLEAHAQPPPTCDGVQATIVGSNDDDVLTGTRHRDVIVGLGGNDVVNGRKGNDIVCGGRGNDQLSGRRGGDVLWGGRGNDLLSPDPGGNVSDGASDVAMGGAGIDWIEYSDGEGLTDDRLAIDLAKGLAEGFGRDHLADVENVMASVFGDLSIVGTGGPNEIRAWARNGEVLAGSGDDIIFDETGVYVEMPDQPSYALTLDVYAGEGNDLIVMPRERFFLGTWECYVDDGGEVVDGGQGIDRIDFSGRRCGRSVTVDLDAGTASGYATEDTLIRLEQVIGTRMNDVIAGDEFDNEFMGGEGADRLDGRKGTDILDGGEGSDECVGGETLTSCEA